MKKFFKKTLYVLLGCVIASCCAVFTGCGDLGDYLSSYQPGQEHEHPSMEEQMEAYYEAYGAVQAKYCGGGTSVLSKNYDVEKSLYNPRTVNDMGWDTDEGDVPVDVQPYVYLVLPIKKDLNIDSIALFAKATKYEGYPTFDHSGPPIEFTEKTTVTTTVNIFFVEKAADLPKKIRIFGAPEKEEVVITDEHGNPKLDPDGNPITEESLIEYDDPDAKTACGSIDLHFQRDSWSSFLIERWTLQSGYSKTLPVHEGNYLLFRFETNLGYAKGAATKCYFNFTDLMIRVVN